MYPDGAGGLTVGLTYWEKAVYADARMMAMVVAITLKGKKCV